MQQYHSNYELNLKLSCVLTQSYPIYQVKFFIQLQVRSILTTDKLLATGDSLFNNACIRNRKVQSTLDD